MNELPARQGTLTALDTKNPVLYIELPEGRLKCFGTLVFPKNRYLVLRFGQKDIVCEDVLENMVSSDTCILLMSLCSCLLAMQESGAAAAQVVFAEAWWVGTKESNPEEAQLPIPDSVLQAGARAVGVHASSLRGAHVNFMCTSPASEVVLLFAEAAAAAHSAPDAVVWPHPCMLLCVMLQRLRNPCCYCTLCHAFLST